jgi:type II secretory pathway pseudopilin PulG
VLELMMVVLIIAILITFLAPTFLGASARAKDRAVQSSIRNGFSAAKSIYADEGDYTQATTAALTAAVGGGNLVFVNSGTAPSGNNTLSVDPVNSDFVVLSAHSKSGICFYLSDDATGGGVRYARVAAAGGCAASGAPLPGDPQWMSKW